MNKNLLFLTLHFPEGSGGYTFRKKLIKVLTSIDELGEVICLHSDEIFEAELNNTGVKFLRVSDYNQRSRILKFFGFIYTQIKFVYYLIKLKNDYSQVMVMSGNNFTLSLIFAKFFKKKIIYVLSGISGLNTISLYKKSQNFKIHPIKLIYTSIVAVLDEISLGLSDLIVLESPNLINAMNLTKYKKKLYKKGYMYQNMSKFYIKKDFKERKNLIGYIGRFDHEKGIMNFIEALPLIERKKLDIETIIIGWGPLYNEIKNKLKSYELHNVQLLDKITNDQVPDYLNELKLLVVPSNKEGLPNIVLEAMACGTPVLATPVGGIPDVIKNNETGFIINKNVAEHIVESIIFALSYQQIDKISKNAFELINQEYNYNKVVENWTAIFQV